MNNILLAVAGTLAAIGTIAGTFAHCVRIFRKLSQSLEKVQSGVKCMLRASMLNTYYKNNEKDKLHEYEAQNFELQYAAYKELGGNSFMDKIHEDVQKWEVVR